jgi:hypothetical protein
MMTNAYGWTKEEEEARNRFAASAMHAMLMRDKSEFPDVMTISAFAFEMADEVLHAGVRGVTDLSRKGEK